MDRIKEEDYLYICTRIKVLERNLLSRDKLRMLAVAKTDEEALKILQDAGWQLQSLSGAEEAIASRRNETLKLLYRYAPDRRIIDLFRLRYDYHNVKVYVKARAQGIDADEMYSDAGTVPAETLRTALKEHRGDDIPKLLYDAAAAAQDLLARTRDPQQSDGLLDRAMAAQMLELAVAAKSKFLTSYVKLYIDGANLRVAVRAARAQKGAEYLRFALTEGGTIPTNPLRSGLTPELLHKLFGRGELSEAADAAVQALAGGDMALLDKLCDEALMHHLNSARLTPFNEAQVASYLLAVENELVAVRTILAGRKMHLPEERLLERLRESYV